MILLALIVADSPRNACTDSEVEAVFLAGNGLKRHEGLVEEAKRGGIGALFLGDSIKDSWRDPRKKAGNENFAPRHAANFGISADRTQHVLWRLEHGEVDAPAERDRRDQHGAGQAG